MRNNSKISIEFQIQILSANDEFRKENELKRFLSTDELVSNSKPLIGPSNHNGSKPFDVYPVQGAIQAGQKIDLTLVFQPDHESDLYSDQIYIRLKSSEFNSRYIQLVGKSRSKSFIYFKGVDYLAKTCKSSGESTFLQDFETVPAESDKPPEKEKEKDSLAKEQPAQQPQAPVPILVQLISTLNSSSSKSQDEFTTAEKVIQIGCIRTNFLGSEGRKEVKKNGEFAFESLKEINSKGFSIDLAKVSSLWSLTSGQLARTTTRVCELNSRSFRAPSSRAERGTSKSRGKLDQSPLDQWSARNAKPLFSWSFLKETAPGLRCKCSEIRELEKAVDKNSCRFQMNQSSLASVTVTTKSNSQVEYWRLMLHGRILASQGSGNQSATTGAGGNQQLRNQSQMSLSQSLTNVVNAP